MKSIARITERDSYMELYWYKIIKFMRGKASCHFQNVIGKVNGKRLWIDTIINKAKSIIDKLKVNIVCSGATTKNNKTHTVKK